MRNVEKVEQQETALLSLSIIQCRGKPSFLREEGYQVYPMYC